MIKGFDGLRALAVLVVFANHWTIIGRTYTTGNYGVWLFFVLSGFLIVRGLYADRRKIEAGASTAALLGQFYARRALRIFPPYYLVLAVFTIASLFVAIPNWDHVSAAYHFLYLSNIYIGYVHQGFIGWFTHFWSLAVEQQFYFFFAPLVLLLPSRFTKSLMGAIVLLAVATLGIMVLGSSSNIALYTNPIINFGMIALGGLIGLTVSGEPQAGRNSLPATVSLCCLAAFPLAASLLQAAGIQTLHGFEQCSLLFAALLIRSVFLNQESLFVRVLELKPLRYLGVISYGFYLYHNLVPRTLLDVVSRHLGLGSVGVTVNILFGFLLSVALADLSWRFLERPLLRLKHRLAPQGSPGKSDTSVPQGSLAVATMANVETGVR